MKREEEEEEVEVQATQGEEKKDNLLKREIVGIAKGRKVFNCGNKQREKSTVI